MFLKAPFLLYSLGFEAFYTCFLLCIRYRSRDSVWRVTFVLSSLEGALWYQPISFSSTCLLLLYWTECCSPEHSIVRTYWKWIASLNILENMHDKGKCMLRFDLGFLWVGLWPSSSSTSTVMLELAIILTQQWSKTVSAHAKVCTYIWDHIWVSMTT